MAMKKNSEKLLGICLALILCISACFIPGKAFATPVSSDPDTDEMWNAEWFNIGEWFEKTGNSAYEGFHFRTPDITGVDYYITFDNATDYETNFYLYSLDSVDWGNWLEDGPISTSAHAMTLYPLHLLPDADYFLKVDAFPSSEGYSFAIEMTPYPLGKGYITSLKAGRKNLTVRYKERLWTDKYQIAVRKKGTSKWKYYKTTKLKRTIKKLQSKKKYYVKVRSLRYFNGERYTGKWSNTRSVTVK